MRELFLKVTSIVAVLAVAIILGGKAGRLWSERVAANAQDTKAKESTAYLLQNLRSIAVGSPFPEVVLISLMDQMPTTLPETLPIGGLVIYLTADCESCGNTLRQLPKTLSDLHLESSGIAIIIDGDSVEAEAFVSESQLARRCFMDAENALRNSYHVWSYPAFFRLDTNLRVTHMTANLVDSDRLAEALELN